MTNKQLAKLLRETGNLLFDKTYDPNEKLLHDEAADRLENQNEWISVEDRLPTDQKEVLCYYGFDRGDGDLGMMFMGTLCYFCFDENPHWQHADHDLIVTHWMPLPTPPIEKEK